MSSLVRSFLFLCLFLPFASGSYSQAEESSFGWSYQGLSDDLITKVESAAQYLEATPTGKEVLKTFKGFKISILIESGMSGNGYYDDEYSALVLNRQVLEKWPNWKIARLLCHELTHAVQHSLGISRANYDNNDSKPISASGIMEFSALSMEVRFWIEAKAPLDEQRDFNSLRMWAYLFFPETVRIGWAYTNSTQRFKEPVATWADARLANYWTSILESEIDWRKSHQYLFPTQFQEASIALEYLKERYGKPVSPWLPQYLESLGAIPANPSSNDLGLIQLHRLLP